MRTLTTALIVSLMVSSLIMGVNGYVIIKGADGNNCKERTPTNITYSNGASTLDYYPVEYAREAWNDVPAMVHFSAGSSGPAIQVTSANDPNYQNTNGQQYNALTFTVGNPNLLITCTGGYFDTPLGILFNDASGALQGKSFDYISGTAGHEFGHTIGLGEALDPYSLGYANGATTDSEGIYFPMLDDIKGVASQYGWAGDTPMPNSWYTPPNAVQAPGVTAPIRLQVTPSASNTYSSMTQAATLPMSNLAMMFAYVTPTTMYRFHIGWEKSQGGFPSAPTFANLELDSDGVKLVDWQGTGSPHSVCVLCGKIAVNSGPFFLELVVRNVAGVDRTAPYNLKADAYAFSLAQPLSTNSVLTNFLGHGSDPMGTTVCFIGCTTYNAQWSDAQAYEASVWTDTSSNPTSDYTMNDFWNFQGSSKSPIGDFTPSASPSSFTVHWASYGSTTVSASNVNHVSGTMTFSITQPPFVYGQTNVFWGFGTGYASSSAVNLGNNPSASATLYVQAYSWTTPGSYSITVYEDYAWGGGTVEHTITVTATVNNCCYSPSH